MTAPAARPARGTDQGQAAIDRLDELRARGVRIA